MYQKNVRLSLQQRSKTSLPTAGRGKKKDASWFGAHVCMYVSQARITAGTRFYSFINYAYSFLFIFSCLLRKQSIHPYFLH